MFSSESTEGEAEPSPSGRRRKNPRARFAEDSSSGGFRHADGITWTGEILRREAAESQVLVVEDPACFVVAVPDLPGGLLSNHDRELLGAARRLADAINGAVIVLALGGRGDFGAVGADRVVLQQQIEFLGYAPELRAASICAAAAQFEPRHILLCDSLDGGDVGRRVAANLSEQPATDVHRLATDELCRTGRGGRSDFSGAPPRIILVREGAVDPHVGVRREARVIDSPPASATAKVRDEGMAAVDPGAIPLGEAPFVVGAGNGVRDWASFHALAGALGAAVGGSRVACDSGYLERDRQIGASGQSISALCYLAFGISGAIQHLQGIEACERIVVVNTDPHCPLAKRADLAIIADVQTVIPALIRQLGGRDG